MRIFKCSVCNVFPFAAVYTCCAGHPVCGDCRPTIKKCPKLLCNRHLLPGRDVHMENRIHLGRFGCLYRKYGCQRMLRLSIYEKHLITCKERVYCCPGCQIHVPVVPTDFDDTPPSTIEDDANMDTEEYARRYLIDGTKDPWLCTEEPEPILGISAEETVAMKPTPPTLGRPAANVGYLFRDGNAINTLIISELKGRKNKKKPFF